MFYDTLDEIFSTAQFTEMIESCENSELLHDSAIALVSLVQHGKILVLLYAVFMLTHDAKHFKVAISQCVGHSFARENRVRVWCTVELMIMTMNTRKSLEWDLKNLLDRVAQNS